MTLRHTLGRSTWTRALRCGRLLLGQGDVAGLMLLCVLCLFSALNGLLMALEDLLVPGLASLPLERVIFILGHHRSGTTNLHKALRPHPNLRTGTMFDALFPSLVLKRLFRTRPARAVFDALNRDAARRYDSANHAVGLDEELEEHLWLLHHLRSEAFLLMFPSLLLADGALMPDMVHVSDDELHFVVRCLQRMVFDQKDSTAWYVARPLLFTMHVQALLRHVPKAQVVLCIREPLPAIRSQGAMSQAQLRCAVDDPRLVAWVQGFYQEASIRQYQGMLALMEDAAHAQQVHVVQFDALQADTPGVITRLLRDLGLPVVDLPAVRSERHNGAAPLQLISAERVEADLGPTYRQLLARLPEASHG